MKAASDGTNVLATGTPTRAETAQVCSTSVLVHDLKSMRARHGAETAEGHRCSNLLELIENYGKAIDEAHKARIEERIRWQMRSLARICAIPTQHRG